MTRIPVSASLLRRRWTLSLLLIIQVFCFGATAAAQSSIPTDPTNTPHLDPVQPGTLQKKTTQEEADEQLKQQVHQRILGFIPNFNTSNYRDAATLTSRQKFRLALRSSVDPFQFLVAAVDGGVGQWNNSFKGYGQGAGGYGKRVGAAYADAFDGSLMGGAVFPSLLHQDPRYFRKGTGTVRQRMFYAISTVAIAKSDNGNWQPNYSNILGNLASGGLSNLYYPSQDRGAGLTLTRALTVTAEGSLGSLFVEFWPDISRKLHRKP